MSTLARTVVASQQLEAVYTKHIKAQVPHAFCPVVGSRTECMWNACDQCVEYVRNKTGH